MSETRSKIAWLVVASLAALALPTVTVHTLPTVAAHECSAVNPMWDCGTCTSGNHTHSFNINGILIPYCVSTTPDTPDVSCEWFDQWSYHPYAVGTAGSATFTLDSSLDDCNEDAIPGSDGHAEWGLGGAGLKATDAYGGGSCVDDGTPAHHPAHAPIFVRDDVLSSVAFHVGSDYDCDGAVDLVMPCEDACAPYFSPGGDGYYRVFVTLGTTGHVYS